MKKRRVGLLVVFILLMTCGVAAQQRLLKVNFSGNSYVTKGFDGAEITGKGLSKWVDKQSVISTYFYLEEPTTITLSLVGSGESKVKLNCGKKQRIVRLNSTREQTIPVGTFVIKEPGYVKVDIQGISKVGDEFGKLTTLLVDGVKGRANYVADFSDYWGRRGPSVHLAYQLPEAVETEWFYNEVTVPKEGETIHSYYMAAGFGQGYFGMQYNSDKERRILFSVWSPFDTQDPRDIPEEDRIKLIKRGEDVYIGEFGNEGSGGQSILRYPWKADTTYPFLMRVSPDGEGNTEYTAYFYATEEQRWRLVASFLRPKTDTWYTGAHSFLENFSPNHGYLERMAYYGNQWSRSNDGKWYRLTDALFTNDATAGAGVRRDYQGGNKDKNTFYLKMGGFFNESTPYKAKFKRVDEGDAPQIPFEELEKLFKASADK